MSGSATRWLVALSLLTLLGGCTTKYQDIGLRDCRRLVGGGAHESVASYAPAKAVLYGRLVNAAYAMYRESPNNLTPDPTLDFPRGYELTAWVQMQDFVLNNTTPSFYGFIAHNKQNPNQAVLAIRGTASEVEWWDDTNSLGMAPFPVANCGNVALGFGRIYATLEVVERSVADPSAPNSLKNAGTFSAQVAEHLRRHAAATQGAAAREPSVEVTGHSLGAPLATYYVAENALVHKTRNLGLYTFASPRVGDREFVNIFNALDLTSWRIVNKDDVVPGMPPGFPPTFLFQHVNAEQLYDSSGKVRPSAGRRHALTTYLYLIDSALPLDTKCRLGKRSVAGDFVPQFIE
ncbi:MAG: lipase family protein [Xanthobacteraceae bacterium]